MNQSKFQVSSRLSRGSGGSPRKCIEEEADDSDPAFRVRVRRAQLGLLSSTVTQIRSSELIPTKKESAAT